MNALILAIFISGHDFQAAVRAPSGAATSARFENTKIGIRKLEDWLAQNPKLNTDTVVYSCVAIGPTADASAYSSAAFEFAYDATQNTFVWSPAQMQQLLTASTSGGYATAMLPRCIKQHSSRR